MNNRIVLVSLLSCLVCQPAAAQGTAYLVGNNQMTGITYAATPVARLAGTYGAPYVTTTRAFPYGAPVVAAGASYTYGAPITAVPMGYQVATQQVVSQQVVVPATYGAPIVQGQQVVSYPGNAVFSYGAPVVQTQMVYPAAQTVVQPAFSYGAPIVHSPYSYGSPVMYWSTPGYGY